MAGAGHTKRVLIKAGGELQILGQGGMPVGLWPDMEFDCIQVPFVHGDRLVLYSDGVSECMNSEQELFGEERLLEYLRTAAHLPLDEMPSGLESKLEAWRGGAAFEADVPLPALELTAAENP